MPTDATHPTTADDGKQTSRVVELTKETLRGAPNFIRSQAREKPLRTSAIALGAGVLTSMLLVATGQRRQRKSRLFH